MAFSTISVQLDIMAPMFIGECQRLGAYGSRTDHTQLLGLGLFPNEGLLVRPSQRVPDQAAGGNVSERLNHPVSCEREPVSALLAATTAPKRSNQNFQKLPSKQRTNASLFTFKLRRLGCSFCIVLLFIVISREVYLYRCMHHFTGPPLGLGRAFVCVLLINHFLGQISGASEEGGEGGRWGPRSPPLVAPDGTF